MNSKLVLIFAFIAISAGLYGVSGYITDKEPQKVAKEKPIDKEKKISVWFAKHDIEAGATISRSDFTIVNMSEKEAHAFSVTQSFQIDFKKHWFLNRSISEKEPLYPEDIVTAGDEGYLKLVTEAGHVPYNLSIPKESVLGGSISIGELVDISTISSNKQNLSEDDFIDDVKHLEMKLLISQVRVLNIVEAEEAFDKGKKDKEPVTLTLQLTNRQLAKLSVARRIAEVEVHKSIGEEFSHQLRADSGDVIDSVTSESVREFRYK